MKAASKAMSYEDNGVFKPSRHVIRKEMRARSKSRAGAVTLAQASKWALVRELWTRVDVFVYCIVAGMILGFAI